MKQKILEVLNSVDCLYDDKMLIELIRWQHDQLECCEQCAQPITGFHYCFTCFKSERIAHLENALSGSPDLT